MSVEAVKQFIDQSKNRAALRAAVSDRLDEVARQAVPAIVEVASAHGFEFSREDYVAAVREMGGDLTERQLEQVVGGIAFWRYTENTFPGT